MFRPFFCVYIKLTLKAKIYKPNRATTMQETIETYRELSGESRVYKRPKVRDSRCRERVVTYMYHKGWLLEKNIDIHRCYWGNLMEFVQKNIGGDSDEIYRELKSKTNLFKFVMKILDKELESEELAQFFEIDDDTFVYSRGETYKIEDWKKRKQLCH